MNKENFQKVLDQITAHPETWDQTDWHCGTTHCFAGWAQVLSGQPAKIETVSRDARMFLNISRAEADYLFSPSRTLKEFHNISSGYNRDGYDCAGYDCAGYNRAGYNRAGYNRDGYNRDGYNRAGYNRAGYDCNGYDCDGYDCAGYDCAGYDCDGLDRYNRPRPEEEHTS